MQSPNYHLLAMVASFNFFLLSLHNYTSSTPSQKQSSLTLHFRSFMAWVIWEFGFFILWASSTTTADQSMLQIEQRYILVKCNTKKRTYKNYTTCHVFVVCVCWAWFLLIKLIQTKAQCLVGSESNLNASLLDASQLLLFPQPVDHHTLEVTPCVQFIFPVIKHRQRGHNQEHLNQIM